MMTAVTELVIKALQDMTRCPQNTMITKTTTAIVGAAEAEKGMTLHGREEIQEVEARVIEMTRSK
jgi:hypothetical protein